MVICCDSIKAWASGLSLGSRRIDRVFTNSSSAKKRKPLKPSGVRGLEVMVPQAGESVLQREEAKD